MKKLSFFHTPLLIYQVRGLEVIQGLEVGELHKAVPVLAIWEEIRQS